MACQQAFFIWHTCHDVSHIKHTYYTCSCCTVGPGADAGAGAIAKCRPLRCPEFRTKATWVAASAAASCTKYKNSKKIAEHISECVAVYQNTLYAT
jgi:hypothetical protein